MDALSQTGVPGADYRLTNQRIDLWPILLAGNAEVLQACKALLSSEELKRAEAFHFEHIQHQYTFAHGVLRLLLARYANQNPATLHFVTGVRGKPRLASVDGTEFNLSHSDDVALIGVTTGQEIGVDIEKLRPIRDMDELAQRFFCPAESEDLSSVAVEQRPDAFFRCWTHKEAYLKAIGDGLRTPLDSFRVTLRPGEPARILQINGSVEEAGKWSLYTIDTIPAYAAAVAHAGHARSLRVMRMITPANFVI